MTALTSRAIVHAMRPARIFVVECDHDLRGMIVELLRHEGYIATASDSGAEAVASACSSVLRPSLLFFGSLWMFSQVQAQWEAEAHDVAVLVATCDPDLWPPAGVDLLRKPFSIETMLVALERAATGKHIHVSH
jgi:CheY-like chemotaxis protein